MIELTLVVGEKTVYFHPRNIIAVHESVDKDGTVVYTSHAVPFLVKESPEFIIRHMQSNRLTINHKGA